MLRRRPGFFSSLLSFFFFSCLFRSSALVELVNAICLAVRRHFGSPAPFRQIVNENESPPAMGKIDNWGGSGFPSFSVHG